MVTLTFDPKSTEDIQAIEGLIGVLKPASAPLVSHSTVSPEERFWANLRPRLGDDSLYLLCAKAAELESFGSMQELAQYMDKAVDTVLSWRRNLGRSEKQANAACGTTLGVFAWDQATQRYYVPTSLKELVLAG